jgi:ABC-type lipoprotein export system ATPase subunit/cell division protein FtsX
MDAAIRLSDVCRTYHLGQTDVKALVNISLTIDQGEFVALVGPSGSGKSTLLNLLGGLDTVTDGEVWVDDLALHIATEDDLTTHRRQRVGFIFQTFNLLPRLTALENVALPLMLAGVGRMERDRRATELLDRVGLAHRLHHRPTELSGGEQQRAAIARALVNSPTVILADEPTGNLDTTTGAEVMRLLRELNAERGVTLIVVTHDPEVAAYADRIVRLRDGEVSGVDVAGERHADIEVAGERHRSVPSEPVSNGRLTLKDLVRSTLDNLRRRPVRNLLTAAGVMIGIITLVAMVSFGVGVQNEVQRNFEALGLENVIVSPSFPEEDAFDPFGLPQPVQPITPDILEHMQALPEVTSVTPTLNLPSAMEVSLMFGDTALPVRLLSGFGDDRPGPPGTLMMLMGDDLGEGMTQGAVLIAGLADQLLEGTGGSYEDLVGREITLRVRLPRGETADFTTNVAGVQEGHGSRSLQLGIVERIEIKAWWYGRPDTLTTDGYDMLVVRAVDLGAVSAVVQAAEDLELNAQSLGAFLDMANQVLAIMQALLGSVGGLALLVAALGVANTMMMAIYERTREIGVMKALGASSGEVRWMFTADAMLLGLIGGAVGVVLGTLLGRLVDWIGHQYLLAEGMTGIGKMSIVPPWLALSALAFAGLIGILGGLYPAARAARLDPVAALRHE